MEMQNVSTVRRGRLKTLSISTSLDEGAMGRTIQHAHTFKERKGWDTWKHGQTGCWLGMCWYGLLDASRFISLYEFNDFLAPRPPVFFARATRPVSVTYVTLTIAGEKVENFSAGSFACNSTLRCSFSSNRQQSGTSTEWTTSKYDPAATVCRWMVTVVCCQISR